MTFDSYHKCKSLGFREFKFGLESRLTKLEHEMKREVALIEGLVYKPTLYYIR